MKRVYQATDYYSAQLVKAYLADNEIESEVSGELLLGAVGEIPANSFPSVWIKSNQDFEAAKSLIAQYEKSLSDEHRKNAVWCCSRCHEDIEDQFSQCWNCGAIRADQ